MEVTRHYDNMIERNQLVDEFEAQGLRMLHDNFDKDWKRGDEPHGTLIFTDEPAPQAPIPEPVRDLGAEINILREEINTLKGG